jgi:hypothetical protein
MLNKFIILYVALALIAGFATAQRKSQAIAGDNYYIVAPGTKLNDVIPADEVFYYPSFVPGKVYYREGNVQETVMNYNQLVDEIQFIGPDGDTLALDNEFTVRFVCIGRDTFYFDKGYILLLSSKHAVRLGVKHRFEMGERRQNTGYDMLSSASSTLSFSSLQDETRMRTLQINEQVVVRKTVQYYFGDKFNHFVPATEKTIAELFPKCINTLNRFLKKNRVDFNNRDDVYKVVAFVDACLQRH